MNPLVEDARMKVVERHKEAWGRLTDLLVAKFGQQEAMELIFQAMTGKTRRQFADDFLASHPEYR